MLRLSFFLALPAVGLTRLLASCFLLLASSCSSCFFLLLASSRCSRCSRSSRSSRSHPPSLREMAVLRCFYRIGQFLHAAQARFTTQSSPPCSRMLWDLTARGTISQNVGLSAGSVLFFRSGLQWSVLPLVTDTWSSLFLSFSIHCSPLWQDFTPHSRKTSCCGGEL